jgi:hypothetical protein
VFGNAGQSVFYGNMGGNYTFRHCTFANYWDWSFRDKPAVWIDNYQPIESGNAYSYPLEQALFDNCIISGDHPIELLLDPLESTDFQFQFNNSLLQYDNPTGVSANNPLYSFDNSSLYKDVVINGFPDFKAPNYFDFRIGINSEAIGKGNITTSNLVPFDITGTARNNTPDMGAYQHVKFD